MNEPRHWIHASVKLLEHTRIFQQYILGSQTSVLCENKTSRSQWFHESHTRPVPLWARVDNTRRHLEPRPEETNGRLLSGWINMFEKNNKYHTSSSNRVARSDGGRNEQKTGVRIRSKMHFSGVGFSRKS